MKTILVTALCMVTVMGMTAHAETSCKVIEYSDHYEAVCNGDETTGPSVNSPYISSTVPSKTRKTGTKPEVRKIIDYRLHRPITTGWHEKLAMRMKLIKEEQEKQHQETETAAPEPEQREGTISDSPEMTSTQPNHPFSEVEAFQWTGG